MTDTILRITLCVSSTICLWSSLLLAYDWQGVRQRRLLSVVMLLWGLAWGTRAYGLIFGHKVLAYNEILPPVLILLGIVAGFTFLVWPLTVLTAPRVGARQLLMFCLPFIVCVSVYYGVIGLFGLKTFTITSLREFQSLISYFSVWFRLVMCATLVGYLIYTIKLMVRNITHYNKYVEENYSEYDKYTIKWMPGYLFGLVAITVAFFTQLVFASPIGFICHNVVACTFLAWLVAKVLVYNSPYYSVEPEETVSEPAAAVKGEDFNSRFDDYKAQIERWMATERPYLNSDLSLQEVMVRFKLNRTYASKIFNDGFGKSFILVVRDYRIEYAKRLIEANPDIAMGEVAHKCGYSTAQAFHKAFVYCNSGLTPGKYAQGCAKRK